MTHTPEHERIIDAAESILERHPDLLGAIEEAMSNKVAEVLSKPARVRSNR